MSKSGQIYMFTMFDNWTEPTDERIQYLIAQDEICPTTGKKHIQGYIELNKKVTMGTVKEILKDNKCHIEKRQGTQEQAINYCSKEESRDPNGQKYEFGTKKKQGKRTDLEFAVAELKLNTPINEIIDEMPSLMKYDKNMERYKTRVNNIKRTWQPEVIVLLGKPGTGKTRHVWDKHSLDEIWVMKESSSNALWFDGYTGQTVVLFDDFTGNIRYNYLLQLLDRYPMEVAIKGGFTNWCPKIIYITSNYKVKDWYKNLPEVDALERRISSIIQLGESLDSAQDEFENISF